MIYSQKEVRELLRANDPIAVCDGMIVSRAPFFERCIIEWLKFNGHRVTVEDSLYKREDYDLSKYKTIAFNTQGEEKLKTSFEKIVASFSKDNLKVVIIGNHISYLRVKDMAEKFGITLIGFDYRIATVKYLEIEKVLEASGGSVSINLIDVWQMDEEQLTGLFFDPKQKFG